MTLQRKLRDSLLSIKRERMDLWRKHNPSIRDWQMKNLEIDQVEIRACELCSAKNIEALQELLKAQTIILQGEKLHFGQST